MKSDLAAETVTDFLDERHFGKYRGYVVDNRDDTRRGRLLVAVPAVFGEAPVWALPCVPYAGKNVGLYALPAAGTGVWIEFEAGDTSFPIWVGCFWADGDIAAADADPAVKFLRTDRVSLRIDDRDGTLEIESRDGATVRIGPSEIAQRASTISAQSGTKRTELNALGFDVHDGAYRVV